MVESKEDTNTEINEKVAEISEQNKQASEIPKEAEAPAQEETKTELNSEA